MYFFPLSFQTNVSSSQGKQATCWRWRCWWYRRCQRARGHQWLRRLRHECCNVRGVCTLGPGLSARLRVEDESLREPLKKQFSHPLLRCTLQLQAIHGKQGETSEGGKVTNCGFKVANPWRGAQSVLLCCNHRRARLERGRFCFPKQGLGRWWHPVIGGRWWHPSTLSHKKEEAWWIDMFVLKSLGLFIHSVRWWTSKGARLSCLPSA